MDKFDEAFCWLHHYEYEFNESPHLMINKIVKNLQKILTGFDWK